MLFLAAMEEIGSYGEEKYGDKSFIRNPVRHERTETPEIASHIRDHFFQYEVGTLHDHFGTKRHQLAAVAFNAMMEFVLAGLESEE